MGSTQFGNFHVRWERVCCECNSGLTGVTMQDFCRDSTLPVCNVRNEKTAVTSGKKIHEDRIKSLIFSSSFSLSHQRKEDRVLEDVY